LGAEPSLSETFGDLAEILGHAIDSGMIRWGGEAATGGREQ